MKKYRQSTNIEDKRRETKAANMDRNPIPLHYRPMGGKETQKVNSRTLANMEDKSGRGMKRLLHGALKTKPGSAPAQFFEPKPVQNFNFRKKKNGT